MPVYNPSRMNDKAVFFWQYLFFVKPHNEGTTAQRKLKVLPALENLFSSIERRSQSPEG